MTQRFLGTLVIVAFMALSLSASAIAATSEKAPPAEVSGAVHEKDTITDPLRTYSFSSLTSNVAYSPDGTRLLAGLRDGTAQLRQIETGDEVRTFSGHTERVDSVAFSPDGTKILTGSRDKTAVLWNAETGDLLNRFADSTSIYDVGFSPDGTKVLTAASTVKLWNSTTAVEIRSFAGGGSAAFSPDGTKLLTSAPYPAETALLWNVETGALIQTFSGHTGSVNSVAYSPDATRVLTGSQDGKAKLWDASTGTEVDEYTHSPMVLSVGFSPDGTQALTGSYIATVRAWDTTGDFFGLEFRTFSGHTQSVLSAVFSPDGTKVLTASYDNTARLWDAKVSVPAVTGQTQELATYALTQLPLKMGTVSQQCSNFVAAGLVISQGVPAGQKVSFGTTVSLVVSSGPCSVTVPNVMGLTQTAAGTALTGSSLAIGPVNRQCSNGVAAGLVISQYPSAGAQAAPGSTVELLVSTGPCNVTVPSLAGLTQTAAVTTLTGANLVAGVIDQQCSNSVAAGLVSSQDPPAGIQVLPGTSVALLISTGACSSEGEEEGEAPVEGEGEPNNDVAVPGVSGIPVEQAQTTLTNAGLAASVREEGSDTVPAGQVIRQEPAAGTHVAPGTAVTLLVSTGPEPAGCGCAGCTGVKGFFSLDAVRNTFGDLFLGALSLMALLTLGKRGPWRP